MQHSETYARQKRAQAADWEAQMLKDMDSKAMELATARGVDPMPLIRNTTLRWLANSRATSRG